MRILNVQLYFYFAIVNFLTISICFSKIFFIFFVDRIYDLIYHSDNFSFNIYLNCGSGIVQSIKIMEVQPKQDFINTKSWPLNL